MTKGALMDLSALTHINLLVQLMELRKIKWKNYSQTHQKFLEKGLLERVHEGEKGGGIRTGVVTFSTIKATTSTTTCLTA